MRVKGTAVKNNQTQTLVPYKCIVSISANITIYWLTLKIHYKTGRYVTVDHINYKQPLCSTTAKKKTRKKRSKRKILNRVRRKNPEGEREKGREARTHAQNRPLTPPPRGREGNRQVIDIYELSSLFLECSNSIDPQNNTILTRDQSKTSSQTVEIESPWNGRLHYSTNVLHAPSVPPSQSSP